MRVKRTNKFQSDDEIVNEHIYKRGGGARICLPVTAPLLDIYKAGVNLEIVRAVTYI